jgi:hypothetical protein
LPWISTNKNAYKQIIVKFPEFSFADVHKEPLCERGITAWLFSVNADGRSTIKSFSLKPM